MSIHPTIRDGNGNPLTDRGTEIITKRFTGVDSAGVNIVLNLDIKEALVHIEGNSAVARFTGAAAGSEQVTITSDGLTLERISVVKEAGESLIHVAAPSGSFNVSVIGWR